MKVINSKYRQDFQNGLLISGEGLHYGSTKFEDVANYYKNPEAAKALGATESYSVCYSEVNSIVTDMYYGTTTLKPIYVDGECNMTKGHFHVGPEYKEYYLCTKGTGFLLKWDGEDDCYAEEMNPGSLHYIDGKYAHRIINAGDDDLMILAVDSAKGGAKYDRIKEEGFPVRCFKRDGKIVWEENKK